MYQNTHPHLIQFTKDLEAKCVQLNFLIPRVLQVCELPFTYQILSNALGVAYPCYQTQR
jgi:hypothetical protein